MEHIEHAPRPRFFAPLPERGIWTAVGLSRGQFLAILALSIALFLVVDGPLWSHLHDSHFTRIMWSYAAILPLTAAALWWNDSFRPTLVLGASVVIAFVKWIVTAGLTLAIGMM
jgi:hypothetical protein